jgi:hypothetical protein
MKMWWGGRGRGRRLGGGRGFGPNLSWSCRWFPWLPRGWWRFPSSYGYGTPYSAQYQPNPMIQPGIMAPTQEREILEQNLKVLENQLVEIRKRLSELETQK